MNDCVSVQGNIINDDIFISTKLVENNQIYIYINDVTPQEEASGFVCSKIIDYDQIVLNVDIENVFPTIDISCNYINVSCGLVCDSSMGLPVLYASDGVLITINGQYLIVQKERS